MRRHVLVLGYGDVGRAYVRGLFERGVLSYQTPLEHYAMSTNILMPSGRLAKLFLGVAAIDLGHDVGVSTKLADNCPVSLASLSDYFQRERARRRRDESVDSDGGSGGLTVAYGLPLITGDATVDEILGIAQVRYASFLACLIRSRDGHEASQRVLDRLERQEAFTQTKTPAMFALHSSAFARSVAISGLRHTLPIHYFTAPHLEGLNAATAAYGVCRKQISARIVPRILVTGRSKRILYFIDGLARSLSRAESQALAARQSGRMPLLAIMSTDPLFDSVGINLRDGAWPGLQPLKAQGLRIGAVRFSRLIGRNPSVDAESPERAVFPEDLEIPLIRHEGFDYEPLRAVARAWLPTLVVILDDHADHELRTMHALAAVLRRTAQEQVRRRPFLFPQILMSGETGREDLQRRLKRRLTHYAAMANPLAGGLSTPRQAMDETLSRGDSWVDVLEDPVDRLTACTGAYLAAKPADVAELAFCSSDAPGAVATILAGLGGYRVKANSHRGPKLSISNIRLVASNTGFWLTCQARLDGAAGERQRRHGPLRVGVSSVGITLRDVAALIGFTVKPLEDVVIEAETAIREHGAALPRYTESVARCCGMLNCPIELFHNLVEAAPLTLKDQGRRHDRIRRFVDRFDVSAEFDQPLTARACRQHGVEQPRWVQLPNTVADTADFANITLKCRHADTPGAAGVALNALLLQEVEQDTESTVVFNTTYASAYECHDERFGLFSCIGYRTQAGTPLTAREVISEFSIEPIGQGPSWVDYERDLSAFLKEPGS